MHQESSVYLDRFELIMINRVSLTILHMMSSGLRGELEEGEITENVI